MRTRARGKEQKGKSTKEKPCKIYIFTEGDTEEIYLQHYDNKKKGIEATLHENTFDIDEEAIKVGVCLQVLSTLKLLQN